VAGVSELGRSAMKLMKNIYLIILLLSALLGCSLLAKDPDTLVRDGYDQKAMDSAISKARSETDKFILVLEKKNADTFSVKAPISENGQVEHFWLTDVIFKDGYFLGKIGNDPGIVTGIKIGQDWKIKKAEISDWMFTRGGKIHGGYTIDPLLPTMTKIEADSLRSKLVR
jgi:uncharacterized protein YegJ (DUF2314 family)